MCIFFRDRSIVADLFVQSSPNFIDFLHSEVRLRLCWQLGVDLFRRRGRQNVRGRHCIYKNLTYFQYKFERQAIEIKQFTVLISDADGDSVYM